MIVSTLTSKSQADANRRLNEVIVSGLGEGAGPWRIGLGDSASDSASRSSVLFLGDVALTKEAGRRIEKDGPGSVFSRCPTDFFDADVICLNLECCLTQSAEMFEPKPVMLVGDGCNLSAIPHPERCVVAVANNHFLDRGEKGAADTIKALESFGIGAVGVVVGGEVGQPDIRRTADGSIGIMAFSGCAHRLPDTARVNIVRHDAGEICEAVASARSRVDVLAVVLHHGVEYCPYPHPDDRRLCRRIAAAGADLIISHHPHVVQGIESFDDCVVFHSVGNFLFDPADRYRPENSWTIAVRAELSEGRLQHLVIEPFVLSENSLPEPMTAEASSSFGAHLRRLSLELHDERTARRRTKIAQRARLKERIDSAFCMVRRVGVGRTAQYYWGRLSNR